MKSVRAANLTFFFSAVLFMTQLVVADQKHKKLNKNPFIVPSSEALTDINEHAEEYSRSNIEEMNLRGTLSSGKKSIANINGEMLMVGEVINGYEIKQVNVGSVLLVKNGIQELLVVNDKYKNLK